MKVYPKKYGIRKIVKENIGTVPSRKYLKRRGIFSTAQRKEDIANLMSDFYFSYYDYDELKKLAEVESNYKKSGQVIVAKDYVEDFKEVIDELDGNNLTRDDNTTIEVLKDSDNSLRFNINYTEYKPGAVELLETTNKKVEVRLTDTDDICTLDFNHTNNAEFKKIKQVLDIISEKGHNVNFDFREVKLTELEKSKRVKLFNEFFQLENEEWELEEIIKLKLKRDKINKEQSIPTDKLSGINAALLDGEKLTENEFVKETIDQGFYFSLATIRYEHRLEPKFLEFTIDFKSRPEMCETKINATGTISEADDGTNTDIKEVMPENKQQDILYFFNNKLFSIYQTILNEPAEEFENEVAATLEE